MTVFDYLKLKSSRACTIRKKLALMSYLLWEDFVYQIENNNVKKSNEMYYPRFTKVIVNFFMTKDQSIPRRNNVNWHYARDDYINSESYKEYYAIASGAEPPKTKASVKKMQVGSDKTKTPPTTKGKRLKTSAKAVKPAKKKQPAKTSKAKAAQVQMKELVPDVPTYGSDDEKISWKSSDEEDDDEVALNDDDDDNDDDDNNDDDDDDADNQDAKNQDDDDEHTDSDNNDTDEEIQDANVEGDKMNEEETNEEAEVDALYKDMNVNLEGRDSKMTDAPRTIV
ncbi:hypothetical protein Tco_0870010 [Tanacetum coccineum]